MEKACGQDEGEHTQDITHEDDGGGPSDVQGSSMEKACVQDDGKSTEDFTHEDDGGGPSDVHGVSDDPKTPDRQSHSAEQLLFNSPVSSSSPKDPKELGDFPNDSSKNNDAGDEQIGLSDSNPLKRKADINDENITRSMKLKKGQKFRSEKQLAIHKEKATLSLSLKSDPILELSYGFDSKVTMAAPLLFTSHEVVLDSLSGYLICKPCVTRPLYVFNESVQEFDDDDYCTFKASVIDPKKNLPIIQDDLMVDLATKANLLNFERDIKEDWVAFGLQESIQSVEELTVQFQNFEIWGRHAIPKVSVVKFVSERQSQFFGVQGPALQSAQLLSNDGVIFKYDVNCVAKSRIHVDYVRYKHATVKEQSIQLAIPKVMPLVNKYRGTVTNYNVYILGKRRYRNIHMNMQEM